jgi:hypothetical protein
MKSLKSCFVTLAFVGGDGHGIRVRLKENEVGRGGGGGGEVRY